MTPFSPGQDVFQTQADQRFNTFSSPLNAVNSNSGDWGMNSAYMTPSYASPYRPRYTGPQGNQDSGYKPGFFRSANHIINPFERGGTNYGGNSYAQDRPYYDAIGMRPIDAGAQAMQNIFVPVAASYAAFKYTSKAGSAIGSSFGGNLIGGLARPMGPAMAGRMAGLGRMAGGFAGSVAIPMAVAQGVTSAVDAAIFDPYIAQRQIANSLQRNTFGISYGEGNGNQVTGGGMSRQFAARQAGNISKMAARDVTFSQQEVSQLTDFAGRSGLMDNISGSQMSKRMSEITRQVKTVMAVANTSDFREAIEIMSKLQSSGVGSQRLSSTMGAIGGLASAAGMSTQRLMNTVGLQGQYLYGANGLTPYVGQLTAGQSAASFGTAFRSGLMSPALMARMGGVEGATQSANSGLLAALQTPYAGIMGMNAFQGGASGSIVGNMSRFGGRVASNPLSAIGNMNLLRPELLSNMAEHQGMGMIQTQLQHMGKTIPGALGRNGKMDAGTAHLLMTQMMGMTDDQARASLNQIIAVSDPKTRNMMEAGIDRAQKDFYMKFADQNSMNKGWFTGPYNAIANMGRGIQEAGAGGSARINGSMAGGIDSFEKWWTDAKYGEDDRNKVVKSSNFEAGISYKEINAEKAKRILNGNYKMSTTEDILGIGGDIGIATNSDHRTIDGLNKAMATGDKDVIALVNSKDKYTRLQKIRNLVRDGKLDSKWGSSNGSEQLDALLQQAGTSDSKISEGTASRDVSNSIFKSSGVKGIFEGLETQSVVAKLRKNRDSTNPDDRLEAHLVKRLSRLTGKELNPSELNAYIDKNTINSAIYGGGDQAAIYDNLEKVTGLTSSGLKQAWKDPKKVAELYKKTGIKYAKDSAHFVTQFAEKYGEEIVSEGLDASKAGAMTPAEADRYMSTSKGYRSEKSKLRELASQNIIDPASYQQSIAALDNGKASLDFTAAVDKFGIYVDSLASGRSVAEEIKVRNAASINPAQPKG